MALTSAAKIVASWAKENPSISRVWFFGSRVRGNHKADSDLDIAVELDQKAFTGSDESNGLATWILFSTAWEAELQSILSYKIQLELWLTEETPTIDSGLAHSSKLVYEKSAE